MRTTGFLAWIGIVPLLITAAGGADPNDHLIAGFEAPRDGSQGHVNAGGFVQSVRKPAIPQRPDHAIRKLRLTKRYLLFPIQNGAKKARIDLRIGGRAVRQFDAELAGHLDEASFWSFLDLSAFRGRVATLTVEGASEKSAALIALSDDLPRTKDLYNEALRPRFHFSQRVGWNNDPNGMVYYKGEWNLYFQHNPYGWSWGNMHWGHAVSKDLVHWRQLPIAIYNKRRGDWAFSGGAVVDKNNTAGWQSGKEPVIVASWTSTGRGECIAYSSDGGRTFTEYEGNPVIKHKGRDPKIIWYAPGRHWVMVVYSEDDGRRTMAFYTSKDLKVWTFQSRLDGYYECPAIFELPVDGEAANPRWVVFAADARYAIGAFDGKTFTPSHAGKYRLHYGAYYASQLFSNPPDGRQIQIGWARIAMPGMPFNQTFTFPQRLTLRTTNDGVRLFAEPIREIESLYQKGHTVENKPLGAGKPVDIAVSGELFDIEATFELGRATAVGLDIGGNRVTYDADKKSLNGARLDPVDGKVSMRVLVDRPMLEITGNQGRVSITSKRDKTGAFSTLMAFAEGGEARLERLRVHELESIWKK